MTYETANTQAVANKDPNQIQVGGSHYIKNAIQPWDYMQSVMSQEGFESYLQGNVIKYMSRYKAKNGVQDLQKAQHYLAKLIAVLTSNLNEKGTTNV